MKKEEFFNQTAGRLIVSCQALDDEPLHGPEVMAKMALAAEMGDAAAIRANGFEDIQAIRKVTHLPVIGLVKRDYVDSDIYITPTKKEVDELIAAGADFIALDATGRSRPNEELLSELISYIKEKNVGVMADISTLEEGVSAEKLGADCVGTTLSGYTTYSPQKTGPDFNLVQTLVEEVTIPVLAEGRYWSPEEAVHALELGAHAVVVGSAITRPQTITQKFTEKMRKAGEPYDTKVVGGEFIKRHP
ncbi:N-acetylmannosamine-6-phosphate 2-epimerase [Halobacillus fulvus]|nr:N-acetylmannosamine-6-phosphate 2-epimerase [Halobacillus fulvus]